MDYAFYNTLKLDLSGIYIGVYCFPKEYLHLLSSKEDEF